MHISVLTQEIINNLEVQPDGIYFDLTLGAGGHSREIWKKLETGTLVCFDLEPTAIAKFVQSLSLEHSAQSQVQKFAVGEKTVITVNQNFSKVAEVAAELGLNGKVNGVIADLGWSSEQLERIPGLAFSTESNLDMRFDGSLQVQAKDLLNALNAGELAKLFELHADIVGGDNRRLVKGIIDRRQVKPFETTTDLLQTINSVLPRATHRGTHFSAGSNSRENALETSSSDQRVGNSDLSARVFQALRIAVNNELSSLQLMLESAKSVLQTVSQPTTPDLRGRLLVISFHSGEDRIVKHTFAKWVASGSAEYIWGSEPIRPSVSELTENMRARSAKLRGVSKLKA